MSEDALVKNGVTQSVCYQIALSRSLSHRYCDPNMRQRAEIGVPREEDIRLKAWQEEWPKRGGKRELSANSGPRMRLENVIG